MVEVGIPVWHARDTLCKCLDSLVAQTLDRFITCLSIDCDGEDYSDIIEIYRARGLKIRIINGKENGGPGAARQRIIDTTQCDYLIFMDADDMLMPRAVEVLSQHMKVNNFDIMRSGFIREEKNKRDLFIPQDSSIITWCFTAGTPILTEHGYRPIETLEVGDMVYTHDGTLQPIETIMSHKADNIVKTCASGTLPLYTTDNHKFFIYNGNGLNKKHLNETDKNDKFALFRLPNNRTIHINSNLAYIIGRYVGDGWKTAKHVKLISGYKDYYSYFLCCSKAEDEYLCNKLNIANIKYGRHKICEEKQNTNSAPEFTLYKANKELIKYIDDCGSCAVEKHFPSEFLQWDNESLKALLQGYFESDGCKIKINNTEQNKIITISKQLALETALILRTLGYNPTYGVSNLEGRTQTILGRRCKRHDEYTVYWYDDERTKYVGHDENYHWTKSLTYTEQSSDIVYNITVANNHSYIAGDFIVSSCHGKIYRVKFLKEKNIRFLPGLRIDEDAYFNLIAWNSTDNRGEIAEYTYIWRDNKNSLTRAQSNPEYFKDNYMNYITSQVRALQRLMEINKSVKNDIISITLINIYYTYMRAAYLEYPMAAADELLSELKTEKWLKVFLDNADSWISLVNNVKAGEVYNNEHIIFYNEPINQWIVRLLVNDRT